MQTDLLWRIQRYIQLLFRPVQLREGLPSSQMRQTLLHIIISLTDKCSCRSWIQCGFIIIFQWISKCKQIFGDVKSHFTRFHVTFYKQKIRGCTHNIVLDLLSQHYWCNSPLHYHRSCLEPRWWFSSKDKWPQCLWFQKPFLKCYQKHLSLKSVSPRCAVDVVSRWTWFLLLECKDYTSNCVR